MPSSLPPEHAAAEASAVRLAPSRPVAVHPRPGGGNNRLYRVDTAGGERFALKWYPRRADDPRDRLGTEWTALAFLRRHGLADIPAAIAVDREAGIALYEWIDGEPVTGPGEDDIDAALAFLDRLHGLRREEGAAALPLASEACLSAADVLEQIARRRDRLLLAAANDQDLRHFMVDEFAPALADAEDCARRGGDISAPLPPEERTLSPSDFGFHNALRRPDGRVAFIDFEYFGWDDPGKLASDFLQHPAMSLSPALSRRFRAGTSRLYGDGFGNRLNALFPLIGLRWCMILLNEFLPDRWRGRVFAGMRDADRAAVKRAQLAKSRARLDAVRIALTERST
ncbi:MAG: hypothetical protein M0006_08685 [Magnetospirillum sp.]|nr:hypothetical protein [Magnetospirillum sp.]